MDLSYLINHYGYIIILIGCMLEGETVAVLGGISVNAGLSLPMVYLMAFSGAWLCDYLLFLVGHYYGTAILKRFTKYQQKIAKIERMIHNHDLLVIISLRFLYGLRTIGPISIGIARVNGLRFIICNTIGSALWSVIFVTIGYSASKLFEKHAQKLSNHLTHFLITALVIFIIFFIIRTLIKRRT